MDRKLGPAVCIASLLAGCASGGSPTRDLALRHVVLYQNGVAYFERTGALTDDHVRLQLKEREVDDVLKTLVVVEQGARPAGEKPPTVTARLPEAKKGSEPEEATWIDIVLAPRPTRPVSIAYAVPSAAWKSAYRIVLADGRGGATALLQAWALVDNVTEEDWTGVALTLATGAPMTFSTHLREPRFVARPDAPAFTSPTATGPVVADRTSVDSDHDGIPDALDKCPDEPGSTTNDGCPEHARRVIVSGSSEIQILQQVQFARDADEPLPASRPILEEAARVLRSHPEIRRVRVEGHASKDEKQVWPLSARRAGAVRAALIARGVTATLVATPFGDTRPVDSNDTEAGRQKNRRAEVHIEEVAGAPNVDKPSPSVVTQAGAAGTGRAAATVSQAAGSFRYDLAHAVTIPRKSTSMVTIVNENVPGEDILLYRPDAAIPGSDRAPLRAARIENRTGAGFLPGPVAMFAGGTFVGEGLLDRLNPGDTTFIPYGVDPASTMEVEAKSAEAPVRVLAIKKGQVTVENLVTWTTRYAAQIGQQAPARLFVRHPKRAGFKPTGLPPASEPSGENVFVPVPLTPGKASVLSIAETRTEERVMALVGIEAGALEAYLKGSALPGNVADRLREVVELRREMAKAELASEGLRDQLGELSQRAGELRESLRSVERTPQAAALQRELVGRLAEVSKKTDAVAVELAAASARRERARAKLVETLRDLALDPPKASTRL